MYVTREAADALHHFGFGFGFGFGFRIRFRVHFFVKSMCNKRLLSRSFKENDVWAENRAITWLAALVSLMKLVL